MTRFLITPIAAALLVAGCASVGTNYNPAVVSTLRAGEPMAAVIGQLGRPNARSTNPNGETVLVWTHATGNAFGHGRARSVSLLFDASGRYVRELGSSDVDMR